MTNIDEWDDSVDLTEEKEENEPDIGRFEIMNYPADTTLAGYVEQWDKGQLYIPPFQRKFVWDQVRASKLIESFLLGLPVPGVFLYKERSSPRQQVIDGNQRIHTIVSFRKQLFKEKKFFLKGVRPEWDGKDYDDLNDEDKFKFDTAVLRSTIIQQLNPKDNSSIYHIFERLNTGGMNLNPMEVRICVAEGKLTTLLRDVNRVTEWRALLQKAKEDQRLRDIELILRVFALHDDSDNYEKPMKRFLNKYIEDNKDADDAWLKEKQDKFIAACKKAQMCAERPFHLKGKLNYALLDSIIVALMDSTRSDAAFFSTAYCELVADEDYLKATTINTSDKEELKTRIAKTKVKFCC